MLKKYNLISILLVLSLIVFAGVLGTVDAQENDMFQLDDRYVDENGDMVADTPEDPDELVDPNVLVFAYAPVEDPAVYEDVFDEFITYLENQVHRPVQYFGVQSYAAQVEAMRAGRLHVTGFSSGSVPDAVNTAGFKPMVGMGTEDGLEGYRMAIITHEDTDINSPEDIEGRELALVSETSGSGYFTPRALLYEEFDLLFGEDYEYTFSGSHDNSILGIVNKDYDVAAVANTVIDRMEEGGRLENREVIETIYESPLLPTTAYGTMHNLDPELQEQIKEAFLSFDWEGTKIDEQWEDSNRFVEISYEDDWEIVRTIQRGSAEVADILDE